MRILLIASLPVSLRNFRGALIEALRKAGHDVHVAAPGLSADAQTAAWLRVRGVICHDIPLSRTGMNPGKDVWAFVALYRLMRRVRPRMVLAYTIKPVIWGILAAWMAQVPQRVALVTGLGYAFVRETGRKRAAVRWVATRLFARALGHATLVFFQNPDDQKDLHHWGILRPGANVHLVNGSGVETDAFAPAPLPNSPPRFLLIARLLVDKGIRDYAQAAALLRALHPQAEFHLVGPLDSNPQGISQAEVEEWHKAGHVIWHGALTDVRPAIACSHVFVLPSSYREGLPRTILEAMSMGRAVITTDAPGCREPVREGVNGYLIPMKDVAALSAAMERFIHAPALMASMGAQSRQIALETYDVHKVNSAMLVAMDLT